MATKMRPTPNIVEAIGDPRLFAPWFKDQNTWQAWRAFLCALFVLPMDANQLALYRKHTDRTDPPTVPPFEAWVCAGRRGGKTAILALTATYMAVFRSYKPYLSAGERARILLVAQNRAAAQNSLSYIRGLLHEIPLLARMIVKEMAESIELSTGVILEVGSSNYRAQRGATYAAILCDELAFWFTDADSANPDTEVLRSLRPCMLTIPTRLLLCASSPYAKRGELWETYQRSFGKSDPRVLFWRGSTLEMNPSIDPAEIEAEYAKDPENASAEYGALFRSDISSFVDIVALRACVDEGVRERDVDYNQRYVGFIDQSGGRSDSFAMSIVHKSGNTTLVDVIRETPAPFSPQAVVEDYGRVLNKYRVTTVHCDRWGAEWVVEPFRLQGINVEHPRPKAELYLDFLPLVNSGAVRLLDHPKMLHQFSGLERRTYRSGRDSVDHGRGQKDDIANSVAGACVIASQMPAGWRRRDRSPAAAAYVDNKPCWGDPRLEALWKRGP